MKIKLNCIFTFMVFASGAVWGHCIPCVLPSQSWWSSCSAVWEMKSILGRWLRTTPLMIVSYCLVYKPCRMFPRIELWSSSPSCQATARESDWLGFPHLTPDWLRGRQTAYIDLSKYGTSRSPTGDAENRDESDSLALKRINAWLMTLVELLSQQTGDLPTIEVFREERQSFGARAKDYKRHILPGTSWSQQHLLFIYLLAV